MDWNNNSRYGAGGGGTSIQCLNFNQDFSCLGMGTDKGLRIFNCDPFGECFSQRESGGNKIIEMLFSTSLVAVVNNASTRRLKIINTKRKSVICELTFPSAVIRVKLNRKRLVVVLVDQIFVYDVSCMKLLHTIETTRNPQGIVALSVNDESILAYPAHSSSFGSNTSGMRKASNGSGIDQHPLSDVVSTDSNLTLNGGNSTSGKIQTNGTIIIYDALNIQPMNAIVAHKSELATVSLNSEGSLAATASHKGTIIRVFETRPGGKKIGEFRRGMAGTLIHSLNFNLDSTLLCSCSSNQTIHIFKLGSDNNSGIPGSAENDNDIENNGEEGNELRRTSTSSSIASSQSARVLASTHEADISTQPASPTDESLINSLLSNKKRSSSISGLIWSKSKKFSNLIMTNYLPQQLTSILEPVRHFAFIKLPKSRAKIDQDGNEILESSDGDNSAGGSSNGGPNFGGTLSVVALSHNSSYVMIATDEGMFYIYNVPLEKGGECVLIKQYSLLDE
ncbi:Atg21 protein [Saccharomycopsis crataegensis]|uniref:Atg21 protein n=1 Tax=Saccharomycopsis crataegensis TaxID=43959 RepID=A0AAV5QKC5_9ASCO|nr:Atg21 protein [Saccharomycopsis crataegensis]